jgi:hypothetical protein
VRVNDPNAEEHIDLAVGRYDVTVTTGPAYATRRQEAAAQLMQLASQNEQFTQVAGDLIIDTLDIPNGEKISGAHQAGDRPGHSWRRRGRQSLRRGEAAQGQQAQQAQERREDDPPDPNVNDKADDKAKPDDEVLELDEGDEIVPDDKDDAAEPEKKRHKTAKQRIDELTAKLRQSERDLEAERSGRKPAEADAQPELKAPDPNDDKYEFGEADPKFIADNVRYEIKLEQAEEAKTKGEEDRKARAKEVGDKLDADWTTMKARGAEKHDDFAEKVDALEVSQPILALAIQASPVGDDAAYHLANAPQDMAIIEARIAAGDLVGAAERFGEIEGATMDSAPIKPTNGNPLDIALYAGRLKTFVAKEAKPKGKLATDAPEPPEQRVRGASGQFEVDGNTSDFAAFEAKVNGRAKARR